MFEVLYDPKPRPIDAADLSVRAEYRRALHAYVKTACKAHQARAGEPCWTIPRTSGPAPSEAVCGARIEATKKEARRKARVTSVGLLRKSSSRPRAKGKK